MSIDFEGAILPIVRRGNGGRLDFLGTGTVLSRNVVVTCTHIFDNELPQAGVQFPPQPVTVLTKWICALVAGKPRPPARIIEAGPDLCCLQFPDLPGAVPLRIARTPRLQGLKVVAVGYDSDAKGLRRSLTDGLKVIHQLQAERSPWLQFGQLYGGVPRGFSGGPVIVRTKSGWKILGMLQLGQERSTSCRFIASDPVLSLLAEHGLQIESEELNAGSIARKTGGLASRSQMEIKKSIYITSSKVGGDVTYNLTEPSPRPQIDENAWHRLELLLAVKSNGKHAAKVARLRELVDRGEINAAGAVWRELRRKLAGVSAADPLIAMLENLFSKGSRP
jgi:hypothetical protein